MINTYELRQYKLMVRKAIYSIEEVLSQVGKGRVDFDGDIISMNSDRYKNFAEHGVVCVECGLIGLYFIKEKFKNDSKYHFNLYALDKNNKEILMTKDHIIPKSKGGPNHIKNYQPMCLTCNRKKGNQMPDLIAI